jgi:hypothetical protein
MNPDLPLHDVLLSSADLEERRLLFAELREAGYPVVPLAFVWMARISCKLNGPDVG